MTLPLFLPVSAQDLMKKVHRTPVDIEQAFLFADLLFLIRRKRTNREIDTIAFGKSSGSFRK